MKTLKEINSFLAKLESWGMLKDLSDNEKQSIQDDLKHIAGTAIMEANDKIQNILPNFYNEIRHTNI